MISRVDFAALNRTLLADARELLENWLPGGKVQAGEYACGDLSGGPGHSLGVNLRTGRWNDRAAADRGGDLTSLYAAIRGIRQIDAARRLMGKSHEVMEQRKPKADDTDTKSDIALRVWRESRPAPGTVVETYIRSRGITIPIPVSLRFHPALKHPSGHCGPAMVAGVQNVAGKVVAIHRTWLKTDGSGKADIEPNRMALGPIRGCAVRLAKTVWAVIIAEGIETALSCQQAIDKPAWAAISAPGMRALQVPMSIYTVYIAADADDPGEQAARVAAVRLMRAGHKVKVVRPPTAGADFNDLLRGGA